MVGVTKLNLSSEREQVTVWVGSNLEVFKKMVAGEFSSLVFASDNLETVAHYYEGCVIELVVDLIPERECVYVSSELEARVLNLPGPYGWGKALMRCPEGATWWSFSGQYLKQHLRRVSEIFPDLSEWFEEDDE